jgi:hypothetical protein
MRTYSIVGMNYIKTEDIVAALEPGTPVTLVREPRNEYDKNAVAVWVAGKRVGYIPKAQNLVLAQFIDQKGADTIMNGTPLEATKDILGMDNALERTKSIPAVFVRSPNSKYPMVQV